MSKCKGYSRHWFSERMEKTGSLLTCTRCGAPNPRLVRTVIDGKPTEFETKILKKIQRMRGDFGSGAGRVHWVAAARRLERLGYAMKGRRWFVTDKGDAFLKSLEGESAK